MTTFPATGIEIVRDLIDHQQWAQIREMLALWPEPEIADLLPQLMPAERALLFRALPRHLSSEVFAHLEGDDQNRLLGELTNDETRHLLANLSPDDRTQLFTELPGQVTQKLLNLLSADDLKEMRQLLGYPEDSVGRLMTPDYVAVRPEWTILQALNHLRTRGPDSETINMIYVTDARWHFLDSLELRRFILADPDQTIEQLMDRAYVVLSAFDDREIAVQAMRRYDLPALPVVDSDGVLVGIVTFDDLLDVADAEATEDFQKAAGMLPLKTSYRETGIGTLFSKRIGWLLALAFMNIFSGAAIAAFEDVIAAAASLVVFLPLLIGSAGNAGSQASTLMIRAMAMDEVRMGDWGKLLLKESFVAGLLGFVMGLAVSMLGLVRGGIDVAFIVALTMWLVVIVGSTIGTLLPFILNRLKLDPATASGPLITSLCDVTGVVIYFTIASRVLGL